MFWTYGGYLAAFYFAFAVGALFNLPSHPRPEMGALAFFVLLPLLVAALSGEVLILPKAAENETIRQCFLNGWLSRSYAFRVGFVAGAATVAAILGAWFGLPLVVKIGWVPVAVILVLVPIGAIVAAGWLVQAAKSAERANLA
jgi:hypothetical protein